MFFILSKTLYFLILPLTWILAIFLWSLLTRIPKRKLLLRRLSFGLLILFSNPYLSEIALGNLEVHPKPLTKSYNTGVILSGILENGKKIEGQNQVAQGFDRLLEGINLYNEGVVNQILIAGGAADINSPENHEGKILVDIAKKLGVPNKDIILEGQSKNTYENAKFSKEILNKGEEFLLITSAYHMRRATLCFEKQNLNFDIYPVDYRTSSKTTWMHFLPSSHAFNNWNTLNKEIIGIITYKLMGYI